MARGEGRQPRQPRGGQYYSRAWSRREKPRCRRSWFSSRRSHKRSQSKTRAAGNSDASRRMFPTARSMGSQKAAGGNDRGLTGAGDTKSTLFIDNLSREVDSKAIRWLLRMDKDISQIVISRKRRPNNVLAFALVHLRNDARVEEALGKIQGRLFLGHKLFARRAKYSFVKDRRHRPLGNKGKGGASSSSGVSVKPEGDISHGQMNTPVTETQGAAPEKRGGDAGSDQCFDLVGDSISMVVEAGVTVEIERIVCPQDPSRRSRVRLVVRSCVGRGEDARKDEANIQKWSARMQSEADNKAALDSATDDTRFFGNVGSGFPTMSWNCLPYVYSGWAIPCYGYWAGTPFLGNEYSGTWGLGPGWGREWLHTSVPGMNSTPWVSGQAGLAQNPPSVPTSFVPTDTTGGFDRVPISIRKPGNSEEVAHDPLAVEIASSGKNGPLDNPSSAVAVGISHDPIGVGAADPCSLPGSEPIGPQTQLMEDDLDDIGLRSLFEDPEFPPGFEPARVSPNLGDDPEETAIKEEARQTLIFAKQLGCTVPNEKLALSNYEELIRKQKASFHRSCHIESDESKEESDRCSRSISKGKGKRVCRTGPMGFSKFSRVSKVATRGKKKAK